MKCDKTYKANEEVVGRKKKRRWQGEQDGQQTLFLEENLITH